MKSLNIILRDFDGVLLGQETIGVDYGAWVCYKQHIPMVLACGDFDSVTAEQFQIIQEKTPVHRVSRDKAFTDFEYALRFAADYERIYVYGALGARLDHELVNLELLKRDARIQFVSQKQTVYVLEAGTYRLDEAFIYVSFLPLESACISLDGFKYPLSQRIIKPDDLYLSSNEIVNSEHCIHVHHGRILFIGIKET